MQNGIKSIKKEQIAFYLDKKVIYLRDVKNLSKAKNRISKIKELFKNKKLFINNFIEIQDTNEENLNNFEKVLRLEQDRFILWREHLPRLAMGNMPMPEGYFEEFTLVDDNSEVVNGVIEIKNHFSIPANTTELSFPLIFGEEDINFEAYITSKQLPFKKDVDCKLELKYNYEDETPYKLKFIPLDKEYRPLSVEWREIQYKKCSSLPIPSYPPKKSWEELQHFQNKNGETINLLSWISKDFRRIIEINQLLKGNFFRRTLDKVWKYDKNNKEYQDFSTEYGNIRIYKNKYLEKANEIIFSAEKRDRFYKATNIITDKEHLKLIKSMRFPLYTIWKDGRTLIDVDVPNGFRELAYEAIQSALFLLSSKNTPKDLRIELFRFLSIINQDSDLRIFNTLLSFAKDKNKFKGIF